MSSISTVCGFLKKNRFMWGSCKIMEKNNWPSKIWLGINSFPFISCVILSNSVNLSEPQIPFYKIRTLEVYLEAGTGVKWDISDNSQ